MRAQQVGVAPFAGRADTLGAMRARSAASRAVALGPHVTAVVRVAPPMVRGTGLAIGAAALLSRADAPLLRGVATLRRDDGRPGQASIVTAAVGGALPLVVGGGLWAGGALARRDVVAHVGMETTQAVALSGTVTLALKGLVGRSRPYFAPGDPDEYAPGRGFLDARRASFPSGHTSAAFAMATVLSRELSARYPRRRWLVRGAMYGLAGAVGVARMVQNVHWPTDVLAGAAVGTLSGMQSLAWHAGHR